MQAAPRAPRQYWNQSELADILGKHRTTIFRWVKAGVLPRPIYLTSTQPVFRRAEIEAWLEERASSRAPNERAA
jgi:predicted DNA-binding transcriptional regulator AlpA